MNRQSARLALSVVAMTDPGGEGDSSLTSSEDTGSDWEDSIRPSRTCPICCQQNAPRTFSTGKNVKGGRAPTKKAKVVSPAVRKSSRGRKSMVLSRLPDMPLDILFEVSDLDYQFVCCQC
jgi:hypothetical protein